MSDDFEKYRLRTQAMRNQMIKQNRLNVSSTKDLDKTRRIPLSDITHRPIKKIKSPHQGGYDQLKVSSSNIKNQLFAFHKQINHGVQLDHPQTDDGKKFSYSIVELKDLTQRSKPTTGIGVFNRFQRLFDEFESIKLSHIRIDGKDYHNLITFQVLGSILRFINWFKMNKFNYLLHDKNNALKKKILYDKHVVENPQKSKSKINDISKNMYKQPYIDPKYRLEIHNIPTHLIVKAKKIGKFMYSVKLEHLVNKEITLALLIATDSRFTLETDSLILLNDDHSYMHKLGYSMIKVYSRWHVYTDKPLDISL